MEKYVIFGAAKQGVRFFHLLKKMDGEVAFFVDNDERKWGGA